MNAMVENRPETGQPTSAENISFEAAASQATERENAKLLDTAITRLGLKNDADLSRATKIAPPVFSKVRHRKLAVGPGLAIRLAEVAMISISEITNILAGRA